MNDKIHIDGNVIEQTNTYKYHQLRVGRDNRTHEIQILVALLWVAFGKLNISNISK